LTSHVALIRTTQGIDTSNGHLAGRLRLGFLMAAAEFERSIIQEATKLAMLLRSMAKSCSRPWNE
jgi:DNA invertase Pin-like site-specific DNA recombinase